jgi:hypothetical protein
MKTWKILSIFTIKIGSCQGLQGKTFKISEDLEGLLGLKRKDPKGRRKLRAEDFFNVNTG